MTLFKNRQYVFSEEDSEINDKLLRNDELPKNYLNHMKAMFNDTEIDIVVWISVVAASLLLLLILLGYWIFKRMKVCNRRKPKQYSLLATTETDLKSFFNPTLSAYEDDDEILKVENGKGKVPTTPKFQPL